MLRVTFAWLWMMQFATESEKLSSLMDRLTATTRVNKKIEGTGGWVFPVIESEDFSIQGTALESRRGEKEAPGTRVEGQFPDLYRTRGSKAIG